MRLGREILRYGVQRLNRPCLCLVGSGKVSDLGLKDGDFLAH